MLYTLDEHVNTLAHAIAASGAKLLGFSFGGELGGSMERLFRATSDSIQMFSTYEASVTEDGLRAVGGWLMRGPTSLRILKLDANTEGMLTIDNIWDGE